MYKSKEDKCQNEITLKLVYFNFASTAFDCKKKPMCSIDKVFTLR